MSFGASAPPPNQFDAVAESPTNDDVSRLAFSVTDAVQPSRVVTASYDIHWSAILGKGQYGTVYRATERLSGEPFACKVLEKNKAMFETQSDITVLLNEVRVLQGLLHPHILTAKDVFLDQSSLYIVLPICEGGDLFDRIVNKHRKGYPEAEARQLMANVVDAVAYLHLHGVVHRDLKVQSPRRYRHGLQPVVAVVLFLPPSRYRHTYQLLPMKHVVQSKVPFSAFQ